ncbi:hypothetical protein MMC25_001657 [Agyrium rufum]|nr:hypothetical protein [Agyrium rufum]
MHTPAPYPTKRSLQYRRSGADELHIVSQPPDFLLPAYSSVAPTAANPSALDPAIILSRYNNCNVNVGGGSTRQYTYFQPVPAPSYSSLSLHSLSLDDDASRRSPSPFHLPEAALSPSLSKRTAPSGPTRKRERKHSPAKQAQRRRLPPSHSVQERGRTHIARTHLPPSTHGLEIARKLLQQEAQEHKRGREVERRLEEKGVAAVAARRQREDAAESGLVGYVSVSYDIASLWSAYEQRCDSWPYDCTLPGDGRFTVAHREEVWITSARGEEIRSKRVRVRGHLRCGWTIGRTGMRQDRRWWSREQGRVYLGGDNRRKEGGGERRKPGREGDAKAGDVETKVAWPRRLWKKIDDYIGRRRDVSRKRGRS